MARCYHEQARWVSQALNPSYGLKYGITSEPNPTSRYPLSFYTATNSQMEVIAAYSNRGYARAHEIIATGIYSMNNNGQFPPLSAIP
jgi:hypothetical protein